MLARYVHRQLTSPAWQQMIEAYNENRLQKPWLRRWEVNPEKSFLLTGMLDIDDGQSDGAWSRSKAWFGKAQAGRRTVKLAVIGPLLVLSANVLRNLNQLKSGSGGENQLTDAIGGGSGPKATMFLRPTAFKGQSVSTAALNSGFLQADGLLWAGPRGKTGAIDLRAYLQDIMQGGKLRAISAGHKGRAFMANFYLGSQAARGVHRGFACVPKALACLQAIRPSLYKIGHRGGRDAV